MESRKGDRFDEKEIHADNLRSRYGYFALPSDCMRAESLLDDYVFSRDDVSSEDAAFLGAHIGNCQECRTKYTELLQWKNLLISAKYEAPENLRKSVMDYINEEHKKTSKSALFKKNMFRFRFSAAAASVLMLTVSVLIISIMNKNPMSDMKQSEMQNEMMFDAGYSTYAAMGGEAETSEPEKGDNALDEVYSDYSSNAGAGESDDDNAVLYMLPSEQEYGVSLDIPAVSESLSDDVQEAFTLEEQESAEEEPAYEKRVAITSVASSPPPLSECKKYIDAVYMLDYINIIIGEDSVQKWLDETIYSESDSDTEAEQKQDSEDRPLLYEAVAYFGIHEETLTALDKASEGAEYYLGGDAVRALYSQNWEALYKSGTSPEGE